jgi:hypothetical protein
VDLLQGTVPEFRRVAVQGAYDHSKTAFVGPRPLRCVLQQQTENKMRGAQAAALLPTSRGQWRGVLTTFSRLSGRAGDWSANAS